MIAVRHEPPREIRPYDRSVKTFMKHVCWRKLGYKKKGQAEQAMHRALADHPSSPLRVYNCPYCRLWHLTHKRERRKEDS